jgi:hypothetical protein
VAVIATTPLTDNEHWESIAPGTLMSFHLGAHEALGEARTVAGAENVTGRQ